MMARSFCRRPAKPYFSAGKKGFRIVQKGTSLVLRTLEKVTGVTALKAASEFFLGFEGMYDGFKERAAAVYELLRNNTTAFLLVTSPDDITIEEAIYFYDKLVEYQMPIRGLIINRVHTDFASDKDIAKLLQHGDDEALAQKVSDALGKTASERKAMRAVVKSMARNLDDFRSLAEIDAENIDRITTHIDTETIVKSVPFFDTDVYDISGLMRINDYVFDKD